MGKEVHRKVKKVQHERQRSNAFVTAERNYSINKENQILLTKMVDISNGKWTSVGTAAAAKRMPKRKLFCGSPSRIETEVRARAQLHTSTNSTFTCYGPFAGAGSNMEARRKRNCTI